MNRPNQKGYKNEGKKYKKTEVEEQTAGDFSVIVDPYLQKLHYDDDYKDKNRRVLYLSEKGLETATQCRQTGKLKKSRSFHFEIY